MVRQTASKRVPGTSRRTPQRPPRLKREPVTGTATVTSKGQITLPKAVRDHYSIKAGDKITFVENETGFQVQRKVDEAEFDRAIAKWRKHFKHLEGVDIDEYIREMRGD